MLGASARALTESALASPRRRREYPDGIVAVDFFGDVDLDGRAGKGRPAGERVLWAARDFGQAASVAALGRIACGPALPTWSAAAYAGGLENRPGLLRLLSRRGALAGNAPRAVRAVRDPGILFPFLEQAGIPHAPIRLAGPAPDDGRAWLHKTRRSGGGGGVRQARPGERPAPGGYLQERLAGPAGSAAFLADGRGAVLIGLTEMLPAGGILGAPGYRWAGNLTGPIDALAPPAARAALARAAGLLAARFGLVGLNGLDYVLDAGAPRLLEVNPRWTGSMDLFEARPGELFDRHLAALAGGPLGAPPPARPGFSAKGILYATGPVLAPDPARLEDLGARDRPRAGTRIEAGRPICSLYARAGDRAACLADLEDRARAARARLRDVVSSTRP